MQSVEYTEWMAGPVRPLQVCLVNPTVRRPEWFGMMVYTLMYWAGLGRPHPKKQPAVMTGLGLSQKETIHN